MKEIRKTVCFAYYADNKWIGWYSGTFGSCSMYPKLYEYTPSQIEVIKKGLAYKLSKINTSTFDIEKEKVSGLEAIKLAAYSSEDKLRGKEIELRVVECPFYDGINPDFDEIAYKKALEEDKIKFDEASKHLGNFPSLARTKFVENYRKTNPRPSCNNWIYADYDKVKEWAKNEPTEFLEIIKPL